MGVDERVEPIELNKSVIGVPLLFVLRVCKDRLDWFVIDDTVEHLFIVELTGPINCNDYSVARKHLKI